MTKPMTPTTLAADAAQALQGVTDIDELAYRFWSIHPKDIPEPVGMPEGYKGGKRAWFYANEMRAALSEKNAALTALSAERDALGAQVEAHEPISDARLECEALCARFVAGEASEKEVVDTIKKIARDNERLAVLLGGAKAAARYSVSAEWAERMLPADDGVTPAAGASDDDAAHHIETALAMARVQDGYASKATCRGEQFIFKANAKAQRQIANYIRRMSSPAPDAVEALQGVTDLIARLQDAKRDWPEFGYDRTEAAAALTALSAENADLKAQVAELTRERDAQKHRGDNHWETLRSIRDIAKSTGDLARIIQWVDDAGSGYNETAETTLAAEMDRRMAAEAKVARLLDANWRLRSYAVHDSECKVNKPPHFDVTKCSCGLRAALTEGTPE